MKHHSIPLVFIALLLVVSGVACSNSSATSGASTSPTTPVISSATPATPAVPTTSTSAPPASTSPTTSASSATSDAQSGTVKIIVTLSGFLPNTVTITVGSTIVWQNDDHEDIEIESDTELFGANIPGGGTYEFTFQTPGTYTYHDVENHAVKGTIVVV